MSAVGFTSTSVALVASTISTPLLRHWNDIGIDPVFRLAFCEIVTSTPS